MSAADQANDMKQQGKVHLGFHEGLFRPFPVSLNGDKLEAGIPFGESQHFDETMKSESR